MKKNILSDIISKDDNIVFCGMAAGKESCKINHYYAKSSNRFWKVLREVGFVKQDIVPNPDIVKRELNYQILRDNKIGITDLVKDVCGMDNEVQVNPKDIVRLNSLIEEFQPRVLAFNGKKVAKIFLNKNNVDFGLQGYKVGKTQFFVLPSTSQVAARWWDQSFWQKVCDLVEIFRSRS